MGRLWDSPGESKKVWLVGSMARGIPRVVVIVKHGVAIITFAGSLYVVVFAV